MNFRCLNCGEQLDNHEYEELKDCAEEKPEITEDELAQINQALDYWCGEIPSVETPYSLAVYVNKKLDVLTKNYGHKSEDDER